MRGEGLTIKDFKFFKEYHDELRAKLDENDKNNFMSCPNDETKFIYIREKSSLTDLNFKFNFESSKDNGVAQSFKDKGNKCFQKEEYKEALDMYNQALIHIEFIEGKFVCFNFKIPHKTSQPISPDVATNSDRKLNKRSLQSTKSPNRVF